MQEPLFADAPEAEHSQRPCVLALGGLDPTGGAGLVRDFLTADALGAQAVLVGTAWTRQNDRGVQGIEPRSPIMVQAAIELALETCPPQQTAVKIGMVVNADIVAAIVSGLRTWSGPIVFDPVLVASSGGLLFQGNPDDLVPLIRRVSILTPNLAEAAWLTGLVVDTIDQSRQSAQQLATLAAAVLVKGGHLSGPATDVLCSSDGERLFQGSRLPGASPRGTGCALSTALAVGLARGLPLDQAIASAKSWLARRIEASISVASARYL